MDFIDSGTCAYRREAFMAVGGFDEHFPAQSAEDVELAFRLAASGARFAFNNKAAVFHHHADRLWSYLVKKGRYGFFRVGVYRRFPSKAMGDSYTPPVMAVQMALSALALLLLPVVALGLPLALPALLLMLAAFVFTTLPLARRAGLRQPGLAACVPGLVYARAVAQGVGVALGLVALLGPRAGKVRGLLARVRISGAMRARGLALVCSAVVALKLALSVAQGYAVLCSGPVDTYPVLAAARDEARSEVDGAGNAGTPLPVLASVRANALTVMLDLKQSDPVAFPAHAVTGAALEAGNCPASATADQWRKAAGHAWADGPAHVAADGLRRTMGRAGSYDTILSVLTKYATDEPWHAANLRRVEAAY